MIREIQDEFTRLQDEISGGPVWTGVSAAEIRSHLRARFDLRQPMTIENAVGEVEKMLGKWQVQVTHPRYFGLFNPSVTLESVIGDTIAAIYNPQLASWRTSPAAIEIERFTLDWLAAKFGLPNETLASFTTGGSEANLSAVIVALTRSFPRYGDQGLRSLTRSPAIYLTQEAHHSFAKIAHMTGLGRHAVRTVMTDACFRMDLSDLDRRIAEDRANDFEPFMVVGTCGTTTAGAIDPLPELGRYCQDHGLWFHVDAAWGGAAILSPTLRHLLDGIGNADSITCDAHKWFSVPMGCGMFFCRHRDSVLDAFRVDAAYMPAKVSGEALDPYTSSIQWSRRFIGLKLFVSLASRGEAGQAQMIEHQTRMGDVLRRALAASGWRIVNDTPLPLICFTHEGLDIREFLKTLHERQIAWMSEARIHGAPVLRACVTSFRTTESEIQWVVEAMKGLVDQQVGRLAVPSRS